jgi:hypothetical protein
MKRSYLFLLLIFCFGCKKSSDNPTPTTPTPVVKPTMHIVINSTKLFSYNITEIDTVSGDFGTKDDYDITTLDYTFTPTPGHKVVIEAIGLITATTTVTATYNSNALGPFTSFKDDTHNTLSLTYTVPK